MVLFKLFGTDVARCNCRISFYYLFDGVVEILETQICVALSGRATTYAANHFKLFGGASVKSLVAISDYDDYDYRMGNGFCEGDTKFFRKRKIGYSRPGWIDHQTGWYSI